MDTGLTIKPAQSVVQTSAVQTAPAQVQTAVATDLSHDKAVSAAANASPARNDPPKPAPESSVYERTLVIDAQSREVIYRVIDKRTRQVVLQVPDEVLARLRAYNQAIQRGSTQASAEHQADVQA